ncbi:MAG: response regulator transcription factor [Opitutaceae bacterium]
MRLLLVEDSPRLQRGVATTLRRSGYAVDVAGDGEEGLWLIESNSYDVIILDIMLPKLDGLTVLRRMREAGRKDHVLLLTARDTVADRVDGLRQGADDYLIKPFDLEELLARVEALCRRVYGHKEAVIKVGALRIDTRTRQVSCHAQPIELTARDYSLLEYLACRSGEVISRTEIEEHICGGESDPMSNVVDSAICVLRKKLTDGQVPPLIHTRRGQGYILGEVEPGATTA